MAGLKEFCGKLRRRLRHRAFFIRLLLTTLLAAFIPLSIVNMLLIRRESASVIQAARAQIQVAAEAAAKQFDDYVDNMNVVSSRTLLAPELSEKTLSASIQNEIDGLRLLNGYAKQLPFARLFALHTTRDNAVYTNAGKLHTNGLLQHYVGMEEAEFNALLSSVDRYGFIPWDEKRGNILYVWSVHTSVSQQTRSAICVMTPDSVEAGMSTLLFGRYSLASVTDTDGTVIYQKAAPGGDGAAAAISYSAVSPKGRVVTLFSLGTQNEQNAAYISRSALLITFLSLAICAALIVLVVFYNYMPLAQLVRRTREDGAEEETELDSVYASYARLVEDKSQLSYQLYERNMLLADHVMEQLLSGKRVAQSELGALRLNMPFYRVACVALSDVRDVSAIIARNAVGAPIYAIEMYTDRLLAFVCGFADDDQASLNAMIETLRKLLGDQALPLGCSTAYDSPDQLFMAYLEAGQALRQDSPSPDRVANRGMSSQIYIFNESSKIADELSIAIKYGGDYMLEFAEKTFAEIRQSASSPSVRHYACCQMIEMYRRLAQAVGVSMDMERLAQITQETDIALMRDAFMEMLTALRERLLSERAHSEDEKNASVMQFIRQNFTNPDFSMDDVAQYLGVSIYTASRVLKNLTGVTFRKYLNDLRVERAKELLLTTKLPVQDVGRQAGFASTSYFIKVFRESEDTTPNNYRWS